MYHFFGHIPFASGDKRPDKINQNQESFASFAKSYYLFIFFPDKIGFAVLESSPNLTSIIFIEMI